MYILTIWKIAANVFKLSLSCFQLKDLSSVESQLTEERSKRELCEHQIEQLTRTDPSPPDTNTAAIDALQSEKAALQRQVASLREELARRDGDRKQTEAEFERYVTQTKVVIDRQHTEMRELAAQRDADAKRSGELVSKVEQLTSELGETSPAFQSHSISNTNSRYFLSCAETAQSERMASTTSNEVKQELEAKVEELKKQLLESQETLAQQAAMNENLVKLVLERDQRIASVEEEVQELRDLTSDREKLLESVQGDKAALSRAVSQNRQLKQQFVELETAFVDMVSHQLYTSRRTTC